MARVGILTYHYVPNYGAAMQAWALQKVLQRLGHDVFFIDYRPSHLTTGGKFHLPTEAWRRRANLVIAYQKAMALRSCFLGDGGKKAKFEAFHREHLVLGAECYQTRKQLLRNPPEADVYVCGSDQIWNASEQYGIDPTYFLDFAPSGVRKVAYAPSFGRPEIHPRFSEETLRLVKQFDAISVREESGVALLKDSCPLGATWVPDPTLLLGGDYPEAILPEQDQGYIFSYTLRSRETVSEVEREMSQRTSLPVISPATLKRDGKGVPGPLEWLGLIKAAKYVITNSYHGTLFSTIFRKPYVFVGLSGAKAGFNERAHSLLGRLGLSQRMLDDGNIERLPEIIDAAVDWERVSLEEDRWRQGSIEFLQDAIR